MAVITIDKTKFFKYYEDLGYFYHIFNDAPFSNRDSMFQWSIDDRRSYNKYSCGNYVRKSLADPMIQHIRRYLPELFSDLELWGEQVVGVKLFDPAIFNSKIFYRGLEKDLRPRKGSNSVVPSLKTTAYCPETDSCRGHKDASVIIEFFDNRLTPILSNNHIENLNAIYREKGIDFVKFHQETVNVKRDIRFFFKFQMIIDIEALANLLPD